MYERWRRTTELSRTSSGQRWSRCCRGGAKAGRPPVWPRRQLIDGIRFRVRTGVPWRDVPVEYGPWNRVDDLFRRWQRNGSWHRILTRLQSLADAKGCLQLDRSDVSATPPPHTHSSQPRALPKHAPVGHTPAQSQPVVHEWAFHLTSPAPACTAVLSWRICRCG
uniref:transposase n=1 Tax=Streptomyces nymphaeiformis TaxID=2663842 RepID=UPI0028AED707|nr:transposase [Streptomyces nymphaeiformis]